MQTAVGALNQANIQALIFPNKITQSFYETSPVRLNYQRCRRHAALGQRPGRCANQTGRQLTWIAKVTMPMFVLMCLAIALIYLFPAIVTWLPQQVSR
jgi:hypothetical protein